MCNFYQTVAEIDHVLFPFVWTLCGYVLFIVVKHTKTFLVSDTKMGFEQNQAYARGTNKSRAKLNCVWIKA